MLDKKCRSPSHLGQMLKQKLADEVPLRVSSWVEQEREEAVEEWYKTLSHMRQVNTQTGYQPDTFALSVHVLDNFTGLMKIHGKYLKCASMASVYISSKVLEEKESVRGLEHFLQSNSSKFVSSDIVRMEGIILEKVGWELLARPTAANFLEIYFNLLCANHFEKVFGSDSLAYSIYRSLGPQMEMTYLEPSLQKFRASVKALALLSCTLEKITSAWFLYIDPLARMSDISKQEILESRELIKRHLFGYVKPVKPKLNRPRRYARKASKLSLSSLQLTTITENPIEHDNSCQQQEELEEWVRKRLSKPKGTVGQSLVRKPSVKRLQSSGARKMSLTSESVQRVQQSKLTSNRKRSAPTMESVALAKVRNLQTDSAMDIDC